MILIATIKDSKITIMKSKKEIQTKMIIEMKKINQGQVII